MKKVICEHCGCEFEIDEVTEIDGCVYCDDCRDELFVQCDVCGEWLDRDYANWFEDNCFCDSCLEEETFVCERCGNRHWNNDISTVYLDNERRESEGWCQRCVSSYAYACDNCGALFSEDVFLEEDDDSGYYYCNRCYTPSIVGGYHSHHGREVYFNSRGITSSSDFAKYGGIGIELEVEPTSCCTLDKNKMAQKIIDKLGNHRAVFERDGSLKDGGFEIITAPHTIKAFKKLDFDGVLKDLVDNNYRSHDGGNCGLHIHFSKSLLGDKWYANNLSKLIYFYHKYYRVFLDISRRDGHHASRWASRINGIDDIINDNDLTLKQKIIKIRNNVVNNVYVYNRYQCINLTNNATIEFRLGRGTLKADTFNKWIDLHIALMKNVHKITWAELDNLDLWLKDVDENIKSRFYR